MPLPTIDNAECVEKPPVWGATDCGVTQQSGEVHTIYITKTPVASFDAAGFTDLIDNDATADTAIVKISVTGSMPAPTVTTQTIERGITLSSDPVFSLTARSHDFSEANYNAARTITYRKKSFYMYIGIDDYLIGGVVDAVDGILTNINMLPVYEGVDTFAYLQIDATWKGATLSERVVNPDA